MMIRIAQLNESKEEAVKQMNELLEQLPEPKEKG
jgi:hypothetical protein